MQIKNEILYKNILGQAGQVSWCILASSLLVSIIRTAERYTQKSQTVESPALVFYVQRDRTISIIV